MKWVKHMFVFVLLLVAMVAVNVSAASIPVDIMKVEVDGTTVTANEMTRLDLERGSEVDVEVEINATGNASDVMIEAFISGYEYSDKEAMTDATHVFDVESGVKYVKKLSLSLPEKVDEDDYKLRIIVTDRNNDEIIKNYNLKLDVPRHNLAIKDVVFSPESTVIAGRALLTSVRVKNMGEKDEESVKVTVEIPELDLSASDYLDEIEYDESVTSEELYIRIPNCVKSGDYDVKITAYYDEKYESTSVKESIYIDAEESCEVSSSDDKADGKVVINMNTDAQDVVVGTTGAAYPMVITNEGSKSKSLAITTEGGDDWATVKVSPSNVVVLDAGETKTVYVYVAAKDTATEGEHTLVVGVTADGKTEQIVLKGNVVKASAGWDSIKKGLEIGLVVLVVILIILGLIIGFSKLKGNDEDEDEQGQTYY